MRLDFSIKRTNRLPSLKITLASTVDFDLATATGVKFVYRAQGRNTRTELVATTIDAPNKVIRVDWGSGDVATIGTYEYQVEVTFSGGVMTFPSVGFKLFQVVPTLEVT